MPPQEPPQDPPSPTQSNEETVDPNVPEGQHVVVVIRRHPFGLILLFTEIVIGLIIALGLLFFLATNLVSGDSRTTVMTYLMLFAVIVIALAALFLIAASSLYRQNRWVITDDSITQVLRIGLFKTQTNGLSMANIEDVSSEKSGIFASIFNFGILKVETAGESPNFHFAYCPNTDNYAKILLDTRERFINEDPQKAKRGNDLLNVPKE